MKILKSVLYLITVMFLLASISTSADDPAKPDFAENKLIYKVKYIDGVELAKLLDGYIDRSKGMNVEFVTGLNTIVITAPKETHSILMKLIEQFDNKPAEIELNVYFVMCLPKNDTLKNKSMTYTDFDEDFNKKIETLNSMDPKVRYEGLGKLDIPLASGNKIYNSKWAFNFEKNDVLYKMMVEIGKIELKGDHISLNDFMVRIENEKGENKLVFKHSFNINAISNKLVITGLAGKVKKENVQNLEIVFWSHPTNK